MDYKVLSSEYLHQDYPLMTLRRDRLQLPNQFIIPSYYVLEYPRWVTVLAITKTGEFVLIRQYRHGIGNTFYELPAGAMDDTDKTPLYAAKRELSEETGYGGGKWQEWMVSCANPSTHNNLCHCFLATDVEIQSSGQQLEPSEIIYTHLMRGEEVLSLLKNHLIIQALHTAPLWKYFSEK